MPLVIYIKPVFIQLRVKLSYFRNISWYVWKILKKKTCVLNRINFYIPIYKTKHFHLPLGVFNANDMVETTKIINNLCIFSEMSYQVGNQQQRNKEEWKSNEFKSLLNPIALKTFSKNNIKLIDNSELWWQHAHSSKSIQ